MNISVEVTENLLDYLDKKVEEGLYKSRSEMVREAIREMIRKDLATRMEEKGITMENLDQLRGEAFDEVIKRKGRDSA